MGLVRGQQQRNRCHSASWQFVEGEGAGKRNSNEEEDEEDEDDEDDEDEEGEEQQPRHHPPLSSSGLRERKRTRRVSHIITGIMRERELEAR